jgi:hypothetical protein
MSKAKVGRCYEASMFDVKGWQVQSVSSIQDFCVAKSDYKQHMKLKKLKHPLLPTGTLYRNQVIFLWKVDD